MSVCIQCENRFEGMAYELAVTGPQTIEDGDPQELRVELGAFCSKDCLCVYSGAVVEEED
jgi:hypothetical protein